MAINKKSSQTTKPERLIYVGPSYKNGKLLKYQVFIGGLPTHIDDVFGTPMNKYYQAAVLAEKEE